MRFPPLRTVSYIKKQNSCILLRSFKLNSLQWYFESVEFQYMTILTLGIEI